METATQTMLQRVPTTPPQAHGSKSPGHTLEIGAWLRRGWDAQCCECGHRWTSHALPSETVCPREACLAIPTLFSSMAAIATLPQPETDKYNARQARESNPKGGVR